MLEESLPSIAIEFCVPQGANPSPAVEIHPTRAHRACGRSASWTGGRARLVPSQTLSGQEFPHGTRRGAFAGRLVNSNQSRWGVCSISRQTLARNGACSFFPSKTSAMLAQNTRARRDRLAACAFHFRGSCQCSSESVRMLLFGPQMENPNRREIASA